MDRHPIPDFRHSGQPFDDASWALEKMRLCAIPFQCFKALIAPPVNLPLSIRLHALRRGWSRQDPIIYDVDRWGATDFLSSWQQLMSRSRINGNADFLINNKLAQQSMLKSLGLEMPPFLGMVWRRALFTAGGQLVDTPLEWLSECIDCHSGLVIRPIKGNGGKGLMILTKSGGSFSVNGREASDPAVTRTIEKSTNCLITGLVQQARYASRIFPDTSNTIRILTLWDPEQSRPFVAAAAHRFGTSRSGPADNWRGGFGGLSSEIDLQTGQLGPGKRIGEDFKLECHSTHPESGIQIAGQAVPGWEAILRTVTSSAQELFYAPFLGWDLLVTEEGHKVIELNGSPGLHVHQVHKPLLIDPRVKRFFTSYGVL